MLGYFARRLSADECAVVLRPRKPPLEVHGPTWVRVFTRWRRVVVVDLRPFVLTTPPEHVSTADDVPITVASRIEGQVSSPVDAVMKVADYRDAARTVTRTAIRAVLKTRSLRELKDDPRRFDADVLAAVRETVQGWGFHVSAVSTNVDDSATASRQ